MKPTKTPTADPETDHSKEQRLDLDKEIVSDLEASDEDTEAIRGGKNYSRVASVAF